MRSRAALLVVACAVVALATTVFAVVAHGSEGAN
jgi:hypothetical protein